MTEQRSPSSSIRQRGIVTTGCSNRKGAGRRGFALRAYWCVHGKGRKQTPLAVGESVMNGSKSELNPIELAGSGGRDDKVRRAGAGDVRPRTGDVVRLLQRPRLPDQLEVCAVAAEDEQHRAIIVEGAAIRLAHIPDRVRFD